MGDQPHLFVFHIPGNLPHNLESLENSGFGLSSEGKELSVKIATFMYLFPLPTGKWESHGWCSRTELKHDLHLPHPFSPAKRKVLAIYLTLSKKKETNRSVTRSENKHQAEEMQEKRASPSKSQTQGRFAHCSPGHSTHQSLFQSALLF